MKQFLTICVILLSVWLTVQAQVAPVSGMNTSFEIGVPSVNFEQMPNGEIKKTFDPVTTAKLEQLEESGKFQSQSRKAQATYHTVTPILTDDPENGIVIGEFAFAVPKDFSKGQIDLWTEWEDAFYLEEGVYDFIFYFYDSSSTKYLVCRENVNVDSDMKIEASCKEACNEIKVNFKLPDGNYIRGFKFDNKGNIVKQGNIYDGTVVANTACHERPFFHIGCGVPINDRVSPIVIKTNENDCLKFLFYANVLPVDGSVTYISMSKTDSVSETIVNDPKSYVYFNAQFGESYYKKFGCENFGEDIIYSYSLTQFDGLYNGFGGTGFASYGNAFGGSLTCDESQIAYCTDGSEELKLLPCFTKLLADDDSHHGFIKSPFIDWDGKNFVLNAIDFNWYYPVERMVYHRQNPAFEYLFNPDDILHLGEDVPTIVYVRALSRKERNLFEFNGRLGEHRSVDGIYAKIDIRHDGKTVCTSWNELEGLGFPDDDEDVFTGPWDIDIIDDNVPIDGMQGVSKLSMHIEKEDEYKTTMAVRMLQFRDSEDYPTSKIDKVEGSKMLLEAGVYRCVSIPSTFEFLPAEHLVVKYASHGTDSYIELSPELVEIPVTEQNFGYGITYQCDLSSVEGEGWFDIRISMKNGDDTMVQTLSPAFKIGDANSVAQLEVSNDVRVEGHRIIAPEGSCIYSAEGRRVGAEHLSSGIYIVVTPTATVKVSVK